MIVNLLLYLTTKHVVGRNFPAVSLGCGADAAPH